MSSLGWVAPIGIAAGQWLVGVRADSDETAALVETVFADHLHVELLEPPAEQWPDVTSPTPPTYPVPASLSLRAPVSRDGRRELSLVYRGGSVLSRTPMLVGGMHALAGILAGLASTPPVAPEPTRSGGAEVTAAEAAATVEVHYRVFVRGDAAVLVNWGQPQFVDDRWLAMRGISELPGWRTKIDLQHAEVVTAPRLEGLRWSQAGLDEPTPVEPTYRWVGLVTSAIRRTPDHDNDNDHDHDHDNAGADSGDEFLDDKATVALLLAHVEDHRQEWLDALEEMSAAGRLVVAADSRSARRAIADVLDRAM